ncbi:3-oxoacyl-ACP synthase [Anaerobranca gottschalkii]|uniref:3-oxoacyl-[acyl-carrier-protein] synthase-3 n=1 Tax=Anaerobranca gottschalkii DSM 13577 TaxID=1120990 RepID=A0A1I0A0D8_9FIRM|nr:3-oxoacyl-ACP synthase [Anaerobranca gottschalkii]SES87395.1 3-oxoacyl-[acyl-carrier-protein] synthase-3 [Anaerobranca gottschalkii DSM 13577]
MRNHVGIAGMGIYIPENYWTAEDMAKMTGMPLEAFTEKIGVLKKPMPGPNDTTSYMGIMAAKKAIENAGIDPKEIDVVIWDGAQHKDYLNWLAFTKSAYEIGATNAWGFDVESMCGSRIVGLELGKSLILSRDDVNTILLVSGYRNCDMINLNYKTGAFLHDIGAGGSAVVLKKNLGYNEVLASSHVADGSFSEDFVVPVGGSKKWPVTPEDLDKMWFHITCDPNDFKERLGKVTMKNWYGVIDRALEKSSLTRKDIDYLAMVKIKRSAHYEILREMNLREDQSFFLEEYGHVGQNDVIISLVEGLKRGRIKDGDVVLLVSAGGGWTWNACVVKWGKVTE